MPNINREQRYIVFKIADLERMVGEETEKQIRDLAKQIDNIRAVEQRPAMECVVVEKDWPEFEPTWEAITARSLGHPTPAAAPPIKAWAVFNRDDVLQFGSISNHSATAAWCAFAGQNKQSAIFEDLKTLNYKVRPISITPSDKAGEPK